MTTQVEILQFLHYIHSLSRVYLTNNIPIRFKFSYGDILLSSKVLYHSENLFETFSVGSLLMYSPGYG